MYEAGPYMMGADVDGTPDDEKRTLWVGDIDRWMDESYVTALFGSVSEVANAKIIRDKMTGMPAGYGFVEFVTHEGAARVLNSLNNVPIPGVGRAFRLNWATFGIAAKRPDTGPEFSLFVGDLSSEITDSQLQAFFAARYRSVKSAKVITDPATGSSRGYGFVRFSDEPECFAAMSEMQGMVLGSRALRLSQATQKKTTSSMGAGMGPGMNMGMGMNPGMGPGMNVGMSMNPGMSAGMSAGLNAGMNMNPGMGASMAMNSAMSTGMSVPPPQPITPTASDPSDPSNTTIFVGNLDASVTEEELRSHFMPFGELIYVRVPAGKNCGFVQFVHRSCAENAMLRMHGQPIGSQPCRLSWGRTGARVPPRPAAPQGAPFAAAGYGYPTYMPSPYGDYYGTTTVPQQQPAVSMPPLPVIAPTPLTESTIEDIYFTESMDQVVKQQNEEFVNRNANSLVPVFYWTRTSSEFE